MNTVKDGEKSPQGLRKGLYLIPSAFTAANIGMGFFAVMGTLRGFQLVGSNEQDDMLRAAVHFDRAAQAIGWAWLFDALDGRLARLTKTTTEIGVQLDSLADVLTFGIAPAVLVYAWGYGSALAEGTEAHKLGWFVSFMYLICGSFRLARFNVQAARPRVIAEGTAKLDKKSFVGLPIPAAAALLAAIIHFSPQPLLRYEASTSSLYNALLMTLVAALSALMISKLRYTSFKSVGEGPGRTRFAILIVATIGMLVWLFSEYVLLAIAAAYVLHGIAARVAAVLQSRLKRSVKTPSPN